MKAPFPALVSTDWPSSDRQAWAEAQQPTALFGPAKPASSWRPATRRAAERGYGMYLAWLKRQGHLCPRHRPAERLTQEQVRRFIEAYAAGRAPLTVASLLRDLAFMARATEPPHGLPWLSAIAHRAMNTAVTTRSKQARLVSAGDLVELGMALMATGRARLEAGQFRGAQDYRDGLIIAALAVRPLRLGNLAGLRIGVDFLPSQDGFRVRLDGAATKSKVAIEFTYPDWLSPAFSFYLVTARPALLRSSAPLSLMSQPDRAPTASGRPTGSDVLWISRRGGRLNARSLYGRIIHHTEAQFGRSVNPHLFRDCVATEIALRDAEHVGIVKTVLGHAKVQTGERFYNQAGMQSAARRHADAIARLRKSSPD